MEKFLGDLFVSSLDRRGEGFCFEFIAAENRGSTLDYSVAT